MWNDGPSMERKAAYHTGKFTEFCSNQPISWQIATGADGDFLLNRSLVRHLLWHSANAPRTRLIGSPLNQFFVKSAVATMAVNLNPLVNFVANINALGTDYGCADVHSRMYPCRFISCRATRATGTMVDNFSV